jgi:hypothetical protein
MTSGACLLIATALAAAPQQSVPSTMSDESVAHVRAALEKPPSSLTLTVPERKADFTVTITERERFDRLLPPILDFKLGPGLSQYELFSSPYTSPWGSQPIVSVDLMSLAMAAAVGINELRKAHARRAALEEVQQAIADYCAAQPNRGAGIHICTSAPAIR